MTVTPRIVRRYERSTSSTSKRSWMTDTEIVRTIRTRSSMASMIPTKIGDCSYLELGDLTEEERMETSVEIGSMINCSTKKMI